MGLQPWPFLISTLFFTPAPYLTLEGEVQTLQMECDLSLSLLLTGSSLSDFYYLPSIFLATGTENQELSLMPGVTSSHRLRS